MTLPKNITDAIDTLLQSALKTLTSAYAMPADEYLRICTGPDRAALEAAIAAAIQPVEPPTDAEVEEWEQEARKVDLSVCTDCPGELYELRGEHLAKGIVLMRRARAPLERLRERVQKRMECTDHLGRLVWDEPTRSACKDVLDWIDEERGA